MMEMDTIPDNTVLSVPLLTSNLVDSKKLKGKYNANRRI